MELMWLINIIYLALLSAAVAVWIAKRTGRDPSLWCLLSLLFPVAGICILICLPEKNLVVVPEQKKVESRPKEDAINPILN